MKIAIVGATGVVGRTLLKVLRERKLTRFDYTLLASKKSAGMIVKFGGRRLEVRQLTDNIFLQKFDFAFFCTSEKVSKIYVKRLAECGTIVIDFSSAYRKRFPLIVPEINAHEARGNIICNPNCSTIAGVMALYKIHEKFHIQRIIYSTYQAVSGAGKAALDDLKHKNKTTFFPFSINNNLIPYIGEIAHDGYSKEERKMIFETKKILGDSKIKITATCVRVPITIGHSLSISFQTEKRCGVTKIRDAILESEGVKLIDAFPKFAMPILARGQDEVLVSRIRKDASAVNSFNMFVVSDNLKKGSAQNAVQIFECLLKQQLFNSVN